MAIKKPTIKVSKKLAKGGTAKSCWPGYVQKGTKIGQSGKKVNNCVKK
jgi:hypothetical protein